MIKVLSDIDARQTIVTGSNQWLIGDNNRPRNNKFSTEKIASMQQPPTMLVCGDPVET
jgi:hypothetical protein